MKKMNKNMNKFVPLIALTTLLLVQFQNCAKKEFKFEDSIVEEKMRFFEYRYTEATPIYFEVQVLPKDSDAIYQSYDILGFAAASDGSLPSIEWKIELFDVNQEPICAQKTGLLVPGETFVNESCVILKDIKIGSAVIQVKKQLEGEWNVYTKIYNE